ncbi:MAG: hypothetical protein LIO85_08830 [Rikenellaceae bacterium]|nr:hypothetical protein [Rikenellaceae bacterium]
MKLPGPVDRRAGIGRTVLTVVVAVIIITTAGMPLRTVIRSYVALISKTAAL